MVLALAGATIDRLLVVFQGEAGGERPAEGAEGPTGGRAVFHGNSIFLLLCTLSMNSAQLPAYLK